MQKTLWLLSLTIAAAITASAANDTSKRMERAANTLTALTGSEHGIPAGQLAQADCIAVIPGFKKVAAVVGAGHGRGFISCRNGDQWSAPGAVALDSGNLGIELGGEEVDIVIISVDPRKRSKLLSDRFVMGSDASAAWGNGKSAHDDPNSKIRFYGHTKGVFAGFGLDGVTLKTDESADRALYGNTAGNNEFVGGKTQTPAVAEPFIGALNKASSR